MRWLCTCLLLLQDPTPPAPLPADAATLYLGQKFADAAKAYAVLRREQGDEAAWAWNEALAAWRGGDQAGAETALARFGTLAGDPGKALHDGLLGAMQCADAKVRQQQAAAQPEQALEGLQQALARAEQGLGHLLRAVRTDPAVLENRRNAERAHRLVEQLRREVEEAKKKQEEQKKQEQEKQPASGNEPKPEEPKPPEQKPEQKKPDEPKPEQPEQDERKQGEPGEDEGSATTRNAPGEDDPDKLLTAEQAAKLLERLKQIEQELKRYRSTVRERQRPVGRDW